MDRSTNAIVATLLFLGFGALIPGPVHGTEQCLCFNQMQVVGTCRAILRSDLEAFAELGVGDGEDLAVHCGTGTSNLNHRSWVFRVDARRDSCSVSLTRLNAERASLENSETLTPGQVDRCNAALREAASGLNIN